MTDKSVCEPGSEGGVLLPLFGEAEQNWPIPLRIILYLVGLLWCFMGVGVICDVFMASIEAVTSKKKRVKIKGGDRLITVKVWNDTVSNLTLMALGSSAPEILLSVIELIGQGIYSGDLGPSTIVGSAAFNLCCIIAVCISAIPDGEVRLIKDTGVFAVTAVFSIWAYFWLIVILIFITPEVVTLWEGFLTFIFMFLLVTLSYLTDIGFFSSSENREEVTKQNRVAVDEMSKDELAQMVQKVRRQSGTGNLMTEEDVMLAIEKETAAPKSRAVYRAQALRQMIGAKKIKDGDHHETESTRNVTKPTGTGDEIQQELRDKEIVVEFAAARYAVLENCREVRLIVQRRGVLSEAVTVAFCTRDGTAHAGRDYESVSGKLQFEAGETEHVVRVPIIDDTEFEEDEDFYCDLVEIVPASYNVSSQAASKVGLGVATATITIIDDDYPGVIAFLEDTHHVTESGEDTTLKITVERKTGTTGKISCKYHTEPDTALPPLDYEETDGTLEFEDGQTKAEIEVLIKGKARYEYAEMFRLILEEPEGGARFDEHMDGGEEQAILSIFIEPDELAKNAVDKMFNVLKAGWTKAHIGHANWKDQFHEAMLVNGGDEDADPPTCMDYATHLFCLPWKLVFAFCPPTDYAGGWVCFCMSLAFIGGVTALVGDMAKLLGCCMGIPDSITAITFVALGTSLPDTFASKAAALQDQYADASVVNVTGSNSVNVFLGLGLPYIIGSLFWNSEGATDKWKLTYPDMVAEYPDGAFIVRSSDLGFSVIVFTSVALCVLSVLFCRRRFLGAELGGNEKLARISSLVLFSLWLLYISLCSWNGMKNMKNK